jgi:hypothetical protein
MIPDASGRDGPLRPVIRTFYDHMQVCVHLDEILFLHNIYFVFISR